MSRSTDRTRRRRAGPLLRRFAITGATLLAATAASPQAGATTGPARRLFVTTRYDMGSNAVAFAGSSSTNATVQ
ncbi:hypothetical protein [Streptomyces lavendulae]|uniref:hypothetical protein n=1 Tax=Streptomyces lavendulae TaxID=1914 RepID=UPI002557B528|nr:hypothetical protein [Streptomyces lavendulae]